jgi:hypothetical protein
MIIQKDLLILKSSFRKKSEFLYLEAFVLNQLFKPVDNIKLASFIKVSKVTSMQPPLLDCEFKVSYK